MIRNLLKKKEEVIKSIQAFHLQPAFCFCITLIVSSIVTVAPVDMSCWHFLNLWIHSKCVNKQTSNTPCVAAFLLLTSAACKHAVVWSYGCHAGNTVMSPVWGNLRKKHSKSYTVIFKCKLFELWDRWGLQYCAIYSWITADHSQAINMLAHCN